MLKIVWVWFFLHLGNGGGLYFDSSSNSNFQDTRYTKVKQCISHIFIVKCCFVKVNDKLICCISSSTLVWRLCSQMSPLFSLPFVSRWRITVPSHFCFLRLFIPLFPPPLPPLPTPHLGKHLSQEWMLLWKKKKKSGCDMLSFQKYKKERRKQVFIASGIIQLANFLC